MTEGIVFDIRRYSIHDGPGIRTAVFLKGCPLSCLWCHNPESISGERELFVRPERCIGCGACERACPVHAVQWSVSGTSTSAACTQCGACVAVCPAEAREMVGRVMTPDAVLGEVARDELFFDQSGGGVTFSGGEPLLQSEFLLECLRRCGARGFHRAVDTSGFAPETVLLDVARETDLFLYDLKHMDPARHKEATGVDNHLILDNLRALAAIGARIWIRVPLIPGINDDAANLDATGAFVASLPEVRQVHLLPYHPSAREKYRKLGRAYALPDTLSPSEHQMRQAEERLRAFGLDVRRGG